MIMMIGPSGLLLLVPSAVCSVSFSFMCVGLQKKLNNLNLDTKNVFAGSRTQHRSLPSKKKYAS
jgi:hypothetical protein